MQREWLTKLGIVIPTLNAARYLPDTLASIQKLADGGAHIIVVDGGSFDETKEICARFGVRVVTQTGQGLYAAINLGVQQIPSPWLTWINGDDVLFYSGLTAYGEDLEGSDIHYGTVDFIDADGRFLHSWRSAAAHRLGPLFRVGCSPILQQGTIFRREVFDRLGGFDIEMKYVADADFWCRAVEADFRFKRLSYPTVAGFRLHTQQISQQHATEMRREHRAMIHKRFGSERRCDWSLARVRYRCSNLLRYVVRWLRSRDVGGGFRLTRSYDVP